MLNQSFCFSKRKILFAKQCTMETAHNGINLRICMLKSLYRASKTLFLFHEYEHLIEHSWTATICRVLDRRRIITTKNHRRKRYSPAFESQEADMHRIRYLIVLCMLTDFQSFLCNIENRISNGRMNNIPDPLSSLNWNIQKRWYWCIHRESNIFRRKQEQW